MGQPSGGGGLWNLSTLIGEQPPDAPPPEPLPPDLSVPAAPPVAAPVSPPPPPPPVPLVAMPPPQPTTPQPTRQRATTPHLPNRRTMTAVAGIAIVAALAVTAVAVWPKGPTSPTTASAANTTPPAVVQQYPAAGTALPPTTEAAPTEAPPTVDAQAGALTELQRLHDQDAGTVRFDGQFVAQLASKNPGIVDGHQTAADGTHTFRATDILAEHMTLRQGDNHGAIVVLLLSTDYGKRQLYNGAPLWVTMALGQFGSASAVNAWCAQRFPALAGTVLQNQCTPRRLEPADA